VRGTQKNDILTGTPENSELVNYRFLGLGGDDRITGSSSDDQIFGGTGRNIETGGEGADLFVLNRYGTAILRDFQSGLDKIGLSKPLSFGKLDILDKRKNTLIKDGDQVLAVLNGINAKQISAADFKKL